MIQATVAVYPLQQTGYEAVHQAIEALRQTDLSVDVQSMNSCLAGPEDTVFQALQAAYEAAALSGPTVMTVTISNACPIDTPERPG